MVDGRGLAVVEPLRCTPAGGKPVSPFAEGSASYGSLDDWTPEASSFFAEG